MKVMRPNWTWSLVLPLLLWRAGCNAIGSPFSELIRIGIRTWTTSAWGIILEDDVKDDSLLEELSKAENKPALLTWAEAELLTLTYDEKEDFTFAIETIDSLSRFLHFVGRALPRSFRFYTIFESSKEMPLPPLFINSAIFMVSYGDNETTIHEMYSNNIRGDDSNVTGCKNKEDLVTIQPACIGSLDFLCNPMEGIWDRRHNLKANLLFPYGM